MALNTRRCGLEKKGITNNKEMKSKPFSIYASTSDECIWERKSSYRTMGDALMALRYLTETPKLKRPLYTILPNHGVDGEKRCIAIKPEFSEQVKQTAR